MTGTWSGWGATASSNATIRWAPPPPVNDNPSLVGDGPPECSSSTVLSVVPAYIHDVNGYYRELGVPTNATRKQLRMAYQAKDGQSSPRLTYIFRQLLNPETRRAYDLVPFGELFMDAYVLDMLKRRMHAERSRRMSHLADLGVNLDDVSQESIERDILAEMGYMDPDEKPVQTPDDTPSEVVDEDPEPGQDDPDPAKFEYSFYAWRTRPRPDAPEKMREWQHQLVRALSKEGLTLRFAVGVHGQPNPWLSAEVGYRTVFFLGADEEPTPALAEALALRVRLDREAAAPPNLTGR